LDLDVFDRVNELTAVWPTECGGDLHTKSTHIQSTPPSPPEEEAFWYAHTKRESSVSGFDSEEVTTAILDTIFDQEDSLVFDASFEFATSATDTLTAC
jgi:hypothetical protein